MAKGFVKAIKKTDRGGFGFIAQQNGPDCFFASTSLVGLDFDQQLEGRRVEFSVTTGPDGRLRATNVRGL